MELTHSFTVPVERAEAWAAFQDIASVAECFPGAVVTSHEGDDFEGTCKVKLGPIALQYAGSGTFVERDEGAGRMVLEAKGRDKRGNGTAGAKVIASFTDAEAGSTKVEVVTDLSITGKAAQFGRGLIQDVSDKLLGQFVDCLESRIAVPAPAAEEATTELSTEALQETPDEAVAEARAAAAPPSGAGIPAATPPSADDALDLGATVLPILVRTYWRQLAAGVVLLVILRMLWRRRR